MRVIGSIRCRFLVSLAVSLFIGAGAVSAQQSDISLRITPGLTVPLGADAAFFLPGAQAQLQFSSSPAVLPWLTWSAEVGYGFSPLNFTTSLSVIGGGVGLGLRMPLGERFWLEGGGNGGMYFGLLNDGREPRSVGGYVGAGAGAFFRITPNLSVGLEGRYQNYLGLYQVATVGLAGRVHLVRQGVVTETGPRVSAPRPLSEAAQDELLQITDVSLEEIFPVFFKYYDEHPVGHATIRNAGDEPITDIKMSLFVGQYMDNPTACVAPDVLDATESAQIDIRSFFNDQVLNITEATKVSAELRVEFKVRDNEYVRTYTQMIRLHDRSAMTWSDNRRTAAFVTLKDPAVLTFSRQVSGIVASAEQTPVNQSLRVTMGLHAALSLYGMTYTSDPTSPYKSADEEHSAVDNLQFPRYTLQYAGGDCDDLSILYCALLESIDIPTAFILVPGHIFIALNLEIPPAEARAQFARAEDLIFRDDETWIPLEVTSISDGFLTAWETGAREWREAVAREEDLFLPTAQCWELYEPVGLPGEGRVPVMPDAAAIRAAYETELTRLIDREIYPLVARLQAQIRDSNESPAAVNRLAVLYARYGLYDRAQRELEALLERDPDYAPAVVNLGNIALLAGDPLSALGAFEHGLELDPDNPRIMLAIARASHEVENYGTASRMFDQVKGIDPALAERFAYLDLRGQDATRAAEIGGFGEVVLWEEE